MKLQDFTFRPIPTPRTCFIVAGSAKNDAKRERRLATFCIGVRRGLP